MLPWQRLCKDKQELHNISISQSIYMSPQCCTAWVTAVMWNVQTEEGTFEPILPAAELEGIYQRILAAELAVHEDRLGRAAAAAAAAGGSAPRPRRTSRLQGKRLAAAMGMTQLTLPFRHVEGTNCPHNKCNWNGNPSKCPCWDGAQKQPWHFVQSLQAADKAASQCVASTAALSEFSGVLIAWI